MFSLTHGLCFRSYHPTSSSRTQPPFVRPSPPLCSCRVTYPPLHRRAPGRTREAVPAAPGGQVGGHDVPCCRSRRERILSPRCEGNEAPRSCRWRERGCDEAVGERRWRWESCRRVKLTLRIGCLAAFSQKKKKKIMAVTGPLSSCQIYKWRDHRNDQLNFVRVVFTFVFCFFFPPFFFDKIAQIMFGDHEMNSSIFRECYWVMSSTTAYFYMTCAVEFFLN